MTVTVNVDLSIGGGVALLAVLFDPQMLVVRDIDQARMVRQPSVMMVASRTTFPEVFLKFQTEIAG